MQLKFRSYAEQVAEILRQEIKTGTWKEALPGERTLASRLQVSRKTLRRALAELRQEGLLATKRGSSTLIKRRSGPHLNRTRVALLLPTPLEAARPFTILWVNRLMALLQDRGLYLDIIHGPQYYGTKASHALGRLTVSHPAKAWIIAGSVIAMQEWFEESGIPVVISGSPHQGIVLPSVDLDHRAQCRHAATVFLRAGHRDLAIFLDRGGRAGDVESSEAFAEGAGDKARVTIVPVAKGGVNPGSEIIVRAVRRLLAMKPRPTGWLLANAAHYLTVLSYLGSLGLKVPDDISLISRDEEPFLRHLHPLPTHYSTSPARFANQLNRALQRLESGESGAFSLRIIPDLAQGRSIGPPRMPS